MRIAVIGSGGIGGYYGALLAKGGHDVVFVARGAHLEAMQRHGLTVRTPAGETTVPVTAVAGTEQVKPVDLVLFCVKSYDTESAAPLLRPLMGPDTAILTFQNGVDNPDTIGAVVGSGAVLPGAVYVALQLAGPGVVVRTGGEGRMVFGEPDGVVSERIRRIAGAFTQSAIAHEISSDILRLQWEKFLFITGIGGVTALARSGIGPLLATPEGRALLSGSCDEIVAVAAATGAPLTPAAARAALEQAATVPPQWRSSMARDLEDGRRLEVDALSGAVVRRGLAHDISTPIHQMILACLSLHQPARQS
jgi:2-dehydropantoate 2-reductase